jgi:hypothetical protein
MARGLPVSTVPAGRGPRTTDSSLVAVSSLQARHLGHGGDGAPPNQDPADAMVLGRLPGLDSDPGLLSAPTPAAVGAPPIRNGLGHAAEASSRHGAPGAGASQGQGRGG